MAEIFKNKIKLSEPVVEVNYQNEIIVVRTEKGNYTCKKVIIAMAPKLTKNIAF